MESSANIIYIEIQNEPMNKTAQRLSYSYDATGPLLCKYTVHNIKYNMTTTILI